MAFKTTTSTPHAMNILPCICESAFVFLINTDINKVHTALLQPPALRLSLTNVIFSSNHAPAGGGIFASDSVDLYIEGCTFELNHAKEQGGAVEIAVSYCLRHTS